MFIRLDLGTHLFWQMVLLEVGALWYLWGNGEPGEPTGARKARFNGYLTNQMSAGKFGCIGAAFNTAVNRKLKQVMFATTWLKNNVDIKVFKNQDINKSIYIPLFSSCFLFSPEALVARAWTSSDTALNGPSWCSCFFVVGIPLVAITWREISFPEYRWIYQPWTPHIYQVHVYQCCLAVHLNCVASRQNCIYFPFPDLLPCIKVNQCLQFFNVFQRVCLQVWCWNVQHGHRRNVISVCVHLG